MDGFEVVGLRLDLVILPLISFPLLAVGIVLLVLSATKWRDRRYDMWGTGSSITGFLIGGGALIGVIVYLCMFIPFQAQYHHWYSTSGEVTSVTNVFEGGSGEISPGYVVELDSVEAPLLFTDPRILSAQGEDLKVTCSLEWVPAGADRLNCWIAG